MLRQRTYRLDESKKMRGWKVMRRKGRKLVSGANSRLSYSWRKGQVIKMPGNGLYLGWPLQYVLDYYSGLADDEVLLTFEFDEADIITGNPADREVELSVSKARIVGMEKIDA